MRHRGESIKIVDDPEGAGDTEHEIGRSAYIREVQQRMRRSRGCELPGTFSPLIIGELFFIHAKPWKEVTTSYIELLISDLRKAVTLVLKDTVDEKSYEGLLRHVINPTFDELEESVRSKADEILQPHRKGHPITYNHYFIDCVQKARETHLRRSVKQKVSEFFPSPTSKQSHQETHTFDLEELVSALTVQTETDMEKFACSEATDCMIAYYKVCIPNTPLVRFLKIFLPGGAKRAVLQ